MRAPVGWRSHSRLKNVKQLLAAQGVPMSLADLATDLLKLSAAGYTAKGVADALLFVDDAKASACDDDG